MYDTGGWSAWLSPGNLFSRKNHFTRFSCRLTYPFSNWPVARNQTVFAYNPYYEKAWFRSVVYTRVLECGVTTVKRGQLAHL
jgi:hypothetical protein